MSKYNGWYNYETWKVNMEFGLNDDLEMYEGLKDTYEIADYIQNYIEEVMLNAVDEDTNNIAYQYAISFLLSVNWHEIAEHVKENIDNG